MIQRILNLIKNAIHALYNNEKGEIIISCYSENNSAIVSVSDNGTGINKEVQEKLFTPHFTTKTKGSGIGLSVVKQIIENHGGEISFESSETKGSTFTFRLPLK